MAFYSVRKCSAKNFTVINNIYEIDRFVQYLLFVFNEFKSVQCLPVVDCAVYPFSFMGKTRA